MNIPKTDIVYQLRNYERNRSWLTQIPHIRYLDLAIIFCFSLPEEQKQEERFCLVTNREMDHWQVTVEQLEELAQENTCRLLPPVFSTLEDMIRELSQGALKLEKKSENAIPMYILSNERKLYGAAAILYPGVLKTIGHYLQDDLYILPSSIHECILVPSRGPYRQADLEGIVTEINESQVPWEEFLSNHVYFYKKSGDFLSF